MNCGFPCLNLSLIIKKIIFDFKYWFLHIILIDIWLTEIRLPLFYLILVTLDWLDLVSLQGFTSKSMYDYYGMKINYSQWDLCILKKQCILNDDHLTKSIIWWEKYPQEDETNKLWNIKNI